jgi:holo-[acyl-carrier protein] synthase
MVIGVGTDILRIDRMRQDTGDFSADSPFIRKTFTPAERLAAAERPDPILYLATRFAGKEAVFKALGHDGSQIRLNEIEIVNDANGQPQVTLSGRMQQLADAKGVASTCISLSFDTEYAIAFAIMQNHQ